MKRVLFIEDDGLIYETLRDELGSEYDTVRVCSCAAAKGRWEREGDTFDCIVLDLMINPLGLELEETDKYTPLFGMAVLQYFTEGRSEKDIIQIKKKTIIYSGYTGVLRDRGLDISNIECIIPKDGDSIEEVVKKIRTICTRN